MPRDPTRYDPRWTDQAISWRHWEFHRALYRIYGIILMPYEFGVMQRDIRVGSARLIERRGPTTTVHCILLTRLWERVFVLVENGRMITALAPRKRLRRLRRTRRGSDVERAC